MAPGYGETFPVTHFYTDLKNTVWARDVAKWLSSCLACQGPGLALQHHQKQQQKTKVLYFKYLKQK